MKIDRGDLVPGSYCGVPNLLASQTSVSFGLPTAVVSSPTNVNLFVDLAYTDTSGVNRQLVSVPSVLTLNPELPTRLAALVHHMLVKDPDKRSWPRGTA